MKRLVLTLCASVCAIGLFSGAADAGCFHWHHCGHHHGHCCYSGCAK